MDNRVGVDRIQRSVNQPTNAGQARDSKLPRPTVITAQNRLLNIRDQRNPISAGPAYTPLTRLAKFKAVRDRNLKKTRVSAINLSKASSQSDSRPSMESEATTRTSTHQVSVVKATSHLSNGSSDNTAAIVELNGNSNIHSNISNGDTGVSESQDNGTSPAYQNGKDLAETAAVAETDESEMPVLTQEAPYSSQRSSSPSNNSSSLRNSIVSECFTANEMSTLDREIGESEDEHVYEDDVQLVIEEEGSIETEPIQLSDLQDKESDIEAGSDKVSKDSEEAGDESSAENDIEPVCETNCPSSESDSEHLDFAGFPQTSHSAADVPSTSSLPVPSATATSSRIQVRQSYRTGLKRKALDDKGGSTSKKSCQDGSQRSPGWRFLSPGSAMFWRRKPEDSTPESQDRGDDTKMKPSDDNTTATEDHPKSWLSFCEIM